MIKHQCRCHEKGLAPTLKSAIRQCACGAYNIYMDAVTLCLSPSQFEVLARLFKMELGMAAARRLEEKDALHPDRKGFFKRENITVRGVPFRSSEMCEEHTSSGVFAVS